MKIEKIPTPAYVIDEKRLVSNLEILSDIQKKSGCRILLAQKAYSAFATYPLIASYLSRSTASGLYEARLGAEEMGGETHVFSVAYKPEEMKELVGLCSHISFNSVTQLSKYRELCMKAGTSMGLRINPECSTQDTAIYDPCAPFSRLGVTREKLNEELTKNPELLRGVSGLHFHTLCEQNADALEKTIASVEEKFGDLLMKKEITWLNMGGGHHITREDYDRELLIRLVLRMAEKYHLTIYLEPGEAVALNAGYLVCEVLDIVENKMPILILDASAACHMPDVLEMPYTPPLRGARIVSDAAEGADAKTEKRAEAEETYSAETAPYRERDGQKKEKQEKQGAICRLASRTCLAGDVIGDYCFEQMPKVGERLYFEDMAIYSMVKNNTFNGMELPGIYYLRADGDCEEIRHFTYEDFKERLS